MNTYEQTEAYILDIPKFAGKHTLQDTGRILRNLIGEKLPGKVIHVAGTNGKGSVCSYLRSILMASGCSVGMFTSPHLEVMRERICLGCEMISEEDFMAAFEQVKKETERETPGNHPSFFEFLFLMAMVYFKEKAPEYIILETGLGGRLDATNCIQQPEICVITEVGFDHMQYLGDTLEAIAGEKAGIIKPGTEVVFFDKRPSVTEVLEKFAKKAGSRTIKIGKDSILNVNIHNKNIDFSVHTGYYKYDSLVLDTLAVYQTENASLAVAAAEALGKKDGRISEKSIREGLATAKWPGRMEEVLPGIYLDGAHNVDGIEAFLKTAGQIPCKGRRILLFGVVSDKQYETMIEMIAEAGLFDRAAVTVLESDRSASLDKLKVIWRQYEQLPCTFFENAKEAYDYLRSIKGEEDIVCIAGSLYLIGQIKTLMRRTPDDRF